ncbi:MAG: hypothetical protein JWO60_1218 [Frankiales bacterium]|nr:hypothetical protein [Frankiales bacterium]
MSTLRDQDGAAGLSRRHVLRGAAVAGTLAYSAPVVQVITMSSASAQQVSGPNTSQSPSPSSSPSGTSSPSAGSSASPTPSTGIDGGGGTEVSPSALPSASPTPTAASPSPSVLSTGTATPAAAGPVSGGGGLAFTGAETSALVGLAGAALLAGTGLVLAGRDADPAVEAPVDGEQPGT